MAVTFGSRTAGDGPGGGGGGGGGLTSWNGDTGPAVTADSDDLPNASGVAGATTSAALDTLAAAVAPTPRLLTWSFSRGGNTGPLGAPIGPAGGSNNAPGFVAPFDGTIISWQVSGSSNSVTTVGLLIEVVDAAWSSSTTTVSVAADQQPAGSGRRGQAATSIAVTAGELVRLQSNNSNNMSAITATLIYEETV